MIYPLAGLLIGAVAGALRARSKGGNRLDMLQWGASVALIFGIVGMFVMVLLTRASV